MRKLEINDFIRTKQGDIGKYVVKQSIDFIETDNGYIGIDIENDIVKFSKNIIELINPGDYVNGLEIDENKGKYLDTMIPDYEESTLGNIRYLKIYPNEIFNIVTKELFKSQIYTVKEEAWNQNLKLETK